MREVGDEELTAGFNGRRIASGGLVSKKIVLSNVIEFASVTSAIFNFCLAFGFIAVKR